ncbi:Crp/Fnr family transcriptional regulator [Chenggangzhangella methanolivorans]|uniref:Crp/Fnr family transcriptional regulator n=1 Tax=Chenggangzhangella methanolivorans TaxID=1437009 RepID=A0A9E6UQP8_9HYPH|nr:Crp/Fnr family transcriptional regulator [Chenggangzhangella methanolivorans]QZO01280.1 Crp/Fnr family transcriptional regulator [Chenggangzhangella methanolivorans]
MSQRKRRVDPNQPIVLPNDASEEAYLIQRGWACVYKLLPDGSRQVLSFSLPGDIVGLPGLSLEGASPFWFESLTEVEISSISSATLFRGLASEPAVARAMQWSVALESAILIERLISLGRRSALVRTAHFILELATRLSLIGEDTRRGFDCPVNQYWLADALGLTAIHLNRVLRELREAHLLTMRSGHVEIHNFEGLRELAAFDADYLTPPKRRH